MGNRIGAAPKRPMANRHIHKPQSMQINFNKTEQLAVILPEMSEEEILQLRQRIESNMRQLSSGLPDIDADPK